MMLSCTDTMCLCMVMSTPNYLTPLRHEGGSLEELICAKVVVVPVLDQCCPSLPINLHGGYWANQLTMKH